ncbi:hypothetical protein [Roseinatronobacter sp. NSM]|uniref:hypothetical protein n=1 Tax=Roseinatronobacter sp. NSM TaxID=3457785 RepID=UPI004036188B
MFMIFSFKRAGGGSPRAMVRGCGTRDEEPSFEMEGVVMAARLDVEQGNTFGAADLAILSDGFSHMAKSVIYDLLIICNA